MTKPAYRFALRPGRQSSTLYSERECKAQSTQPPQGDCRGMLHTENTFTRSPIPRNDGKKQSPKRNPSSRGLLRNFKYGNNFTFTAILTNEGKKQGLPMKLREFFIAELALLFLQETFHSGLPGRPGPAYSFPAEPNPLKPISRPKIGLCREEIC